MDAGRNLESMTGIKELALQLDQMPGVAGHSLFCGIASKAVIAGENGIRVVQGKQAG